MPSKRKLLHNKHKVTVPKDTSCEKKPPFPSRVQLHEPRNRDRTHSAPRGLRQQLLRAPRTSSLTHTHLLKWCLLV